jgi:hypothetical protein
MTVKSNRLSLRQGDSQHKTTYRPHYVVLYRGGESLTIRSKKTNRFLTVRFRPFTPNTPGCTPMRNWLEKSTRPVGSF